MKQNRKSGLFALLAIVLVFTLFLQACSNSNNGENTTNKPGNSGTNAGSDGKENNSDSTHSDSTVVELEPYEVVITYFSSPYEDDALVEAELSEFFKEKINATIKLQPIDSSEYQQRTELAMSTGEKMDIMFSASWLNYFGNISKGAYLPLDELLEEHGQGIIDTINPIYLEAPRLKGQLYAIPTNKEITQANAYTYRKDIVDKYEIPIEEINTFYDLEPWLEVIKNNEPDIIGLNINGGHGNFSTGAQSVTQEVTNYIVTGPTPARVEMFFIDRTEQGKPTVKTIIDPELVEPTKDAAELFRDYYKKGYINADAATKSSSNASEERKSGVIWFQHTVWKPGADLIMEAADDNMFEYISHVPKAPIVTTDLATGSMASISRTSEDPARAMMVLNYLHTDPYVINLLVNGIEGKHYTKTGDNHIEKIADSGYNPGINWVIGNQLLNYLRPGEPDDLYTNWDDFNATAERSGLLGFVFDNANVQNEITELTAVASEYKVVFTGAVDNPSAIIDERNKRLKDAGIERVAEEMQAQIDEWWETK